MYFFSLYAKEILISDFKNDQLICIIVKRFLMNFEKMRGRKERKKKNSKLVKVCCFIDCDLIEERKYLFINCINI